MNIKFKSANLVATPGAIELSNRLGLDLSVLFLKHLQGDWGDMCGEDKKLNEDDLRDGSRLMSVFHVSDKDKLWIITDAASGEDPLVRDVTTILLPNEY